MVYHTKYNKTDCLNPGLRNPWLCLAQCSFILSFHPKILYEIYKPHLVFFFPIYNRRNEKKQSLKYTLHSGSTLS